MPLCEGAKIIPVFTVEIGIAGIARVGYPLDYENTVIAGWVVGCNPASGEKNLRKKDHVGFAIKMVVL